MSDIVIVGGGVIGLTCAFDLASAGATVTVVDRRQVGQEASWAGAGMLPPGQLKGPPELRELAWRSMSRWQNLSEELQSRTGIDNGFRRCGALQVSLDNRESLIDEVGAWQAAGVEAELLSGEQLRSEEPSLSDQLQLGYLLPTMAQVRNPRHLQALKAACEQLGVQIIEGVEIVELRTAGQFVRAAAASDTRFEADQFLLASGAWTDLLSRQLRIEFEIEPIRGQIVLLKLPQPLCTRIIEDGPRYLVAREDGHLLIGSTEERVGYVKENTAAGVDGLIEFATQLVPALSQAKVVRTWSGLRPRAKRGFPYIGRATEFENLSIAAGHFRDGLSQSPATAQLIRDEMLNQPPSFDASIFKKIAGTIAKHP